MSKDDHQMMDTLDGLNYCEDFGANMSRLDCLPAEDSHGAALRKSVLTGLARNACTHHPLEAWAAEDAADYNQRTPRKEYDWEAIAAQLGALTTHNDETMAQIIACKQVIHKPYINDDQFNVDGKLGPKTIQALNLQEHTTEYLKKKTQKKKQKSEKENAAKHAVLPDVPQQAMKPVTSSKKTPTKRVNSDLKTENDIPTWYAEKYSAEEIQSILKLIGSTQTEINEIAIEEIKQWQKTNKLKQDGKFGKNCFNKINKNNHKKTSITTTTQRKSNHTQKNEKTNFDPKKAVIWNDEHFKTRDDPKGLNTWNYLAEKLSVNISVPITQDEKVQVVQALRVLQIEIDETADGCYGIRCIKKLESNPTKFDITKVDFNKRQQNIESFLAISNSAFKKGEKDPNYVHRHARYLTEFMNIADAKADHTGGEQIPFDLVRRMMLDDLCHNQHENLGLLALWIGTAEWGVSSVPSDLIDPVTQDKKWRGPSKNGGKRTREYEQGGVGIADYDVGKLADFYKTFLNENSPDVASDSKKQLMADSKTATKYDAIKSYHAFYEIMSKLFDRDRGIEGDEWNDKASIWIMENWLDSTWDDAQKRMSNSSKAAIFARMQNSALIPVDGLYDDNGNPISKKTSYNDHIQFKRLDSSTSIELMEKQYGDYGAVYHKNGHSDEYARNNYISRLQLPKRVMVLQDYVTTNYKDNGYTVSEDGANILDKAGQPIT